MRKEIFQAAIRCIQIIIWEFYSKKLVKQQQKIQKKKRQFEKLKIMMKSTQIKQIIVELLKNTLKLKQIENDCTNLMQVVNEFIDKKNHKQKLNGYDQFYEEQQNQNNFSNNIGAALLKKQKFGKGLKKYDYYKIQKKTIDFTAEYNKANKIKSLNKFEEALQYYDYAIQKIPKDADYYNNKAITFKNLNKFEEALQYYDYAIQKNPEDFKAYLNKALTLNSLNRFEEALQYYDYTIYKILKILEHIIIKVKQNSQYIKALTLNILNRFGDALEYIDYAIQKNPEDADIYNNKAKTLKNLNRFEEALQYNDYAIQKEY